MRYFVFSRSSAKLFSVAFLALCFFSACASYEQLEKRLSPPESNRNIRLEEIEEKSRGDPATAVQLIGIYQNIYRKRALANGQPPLEENTAEMETLQRYQKAAEESLLSLQKVAITEKRYDDAASLARSLLALGIEVESTGEEADILLASAKASLAAGENIAAFLAAHRANILEPLSAADAKLFYDYAMTLGQKRNAAYFHSIMEGGTAGNAAGDTVSEMIKGVATVVVDMGIKLERGMGVPNRALGSAFFVDKSGILVTNYHVIESEVNPKYEGYSRTYIRTGDASSPRIPAKVLGYDKTLDLALIKAEITPDYVFSVIDQTSPQVGDTVIAIGSPGGLEKTVTQGIVSALGRRFLPIGDVIQIDAAVNPGNSGGPLIDSAGRLVGIIFAGVEQFEGLNFAIPAARLAAALPAMLKGGKAQRPWLGVSLAETKDGAEIVYVAPLTPAAELSLGEGEVITKIAGIDVAAAQGMTLPFMQDILFPRKPGELVAIVTSSGAQHVLRLAERPALPLADAAKLDSKERLAAPLFGIQLETPLGGNANMSQYLVKKIVRGSVADEAGISSQDPISIKSFRVVEKDGYALLDILIKKRQQGYLETMMRLPALLDTPDTL
jgi:S1-C subfamily serine protease